MGSPRDVIALPAVGALAVTLQRIGGGISGGGIMEGWFVLVAILGAAWIVFADR